MSYFRVVCSSVIRQGNIEGLRLPINPMNRSFSSSSTTTAAGGGSYADGLLVQHNKQKSVFFIKFDEGDDAVLEYAEIRPKVLDMYHTGVPSYLQGKGVAAKLAKEAFDYVAKNDYSMKLSCTYLQKYLSQNPKAEYSERVVSE